MRQTRSRSAIAPDLPVAFKHGPHILSPARDCISREWHAVEKGQCGRRVVKRRIAAAWRSLTLHPEAGCGTAARRGAPGRSHHHLHGRPLHLLDIQYAWPPCVSMAMVAAFKGCTCDAGAMHAVALEAVHRSVAPVHATLTATALVASPAIAIAVASIVAVITIPVGHGCCRGLQRRGGFKKGTHGAPHLNYKIAFHSEHLLHIVLKRPVQAAEGNVTALPHCCSNGLHRQK